MKTITVTSSHGTLTVDPDNGKVISCDADNRTDPDCYIINIYAFNLQERKEYWAAQNLPVDELDSIDILDLCYWNYDGTYDKAEESWRQDVKVNRIQYIEDKADPATKKKYRYSVSTSTLWTSFDNGEVEATCYDNAKVLAIDQLKYDFVKASQVLTQADVTKGWSVEADYSQVEITEVK